MYSTGVLFLVIQAWILSGTVFTRAHPSHDYGLLSPSAELSDTGPINDNPIDSYQEYTRDIQSVFRGTPETNLGQIELEGPSETGMRVKRRAEIVRRNAQNSERFNKETSKFTGLVVGASRDNILKESVKSLLKKIEDTIWGSQSQFSKPYIATSREPSQILGAFNSDVRTNFLGFSSEASLRRDTEHTLSDSNSLTTLLILQCLAESMLYGSAASFATSNISTAVESLKAFYTHIYPRGSSILTMWPEKLLINGKGWVNSPENIIGAHIKDNTTLGQLESLATSCNCEPAKSGLKQILDNSLCKDHFSTPFPEMFKDPANPPDFLTSFSNLALGSLLLARRSTGNKEVYKTESELWLSANSDVQILVNKLKSTLIIFPAATKTSTSTTAKTTSSISNISSNASAEPVSLSTKQSTSRNDENNETKMKEKTPIKKSENNTPINPHKHGIQNDSSLTVEDGNQMTSKNSGKESNMFNQPSSKNYDDDEVKNHSNDQAPKENKSNDADTPPAKSTTDKTINSSTAHTTSLLRRSADKALLTNTTTSNTLLSTTPQSYTQTSITPHNTTQASSTPNNKTQTPSTSQSKTTVTKTASVKTTDHTTQSGTTASAKPSRAATKQEPPQTTTPTRSVNQILQAESYYAIRNYLDSVVPGGTEDVILIPSLITDDLGGKTTSYDDGNIWHNGQIYHRYNNVNLMTTATTLHSIVVASMAGLIDIKDDSLLQKTVLSSLRILTWFMNTTQDLLTVVSLSEFPSRYQLYAMTSRVAFQLNSKQAQTSRMFKFADKSLGSFNKVLRDKMTFSILQSIVDGGLGQDGKTRVYIDDFIGVADLDDKGNKMIRGDDRLFTSSVSVSALIYTWTVQQENGALLFVKDIGDPVRIAVNSLVNYITGAVTEEATHNLNAFMSEQIKNCETLPPMYPSNIITSADGKAVNPSTADLSLRYGIQGYVSKPDYQKLLDNPIFGYKPKGENLQNLNSPTSVFRFWSSHILSSAAAHLAISQAANLQVDKNS